MPGTAAPKRGMAACAAVSQLLALEPSLSCGPLLPLTTLPLRNEKQSSKRIIRDKNFLYPSNSNWSIMRSSM